MTIKKPKTIKELDEIMSIMDDARHYQRECGFRQWEDGYPSRKIIEEDILQGRARIFTKESKIAAYAALADQDDEYERLKNIWQYSGRYGVIHRIAMAHDFRSSGIAPQVIRLCEEDFCSLGIEIMRIDTGVNNQAMQNLMQRCGYECRGTHIFSWGERLAYEKRLTRL